MDDRVASLERLLELETDNDVIEELCNEISNVELLAEDTTVLMKALDTFDAGHLIDKQMSTLSGGERKRVALSAAVLTTPDILCLDEVTNHLDANGINLLQSFLAAYPNTVILVSHNRDLTDAVCTNVAHMNNKNIDYYKGNYNDFLGYKAQNDAHCTRIANNLNRERDKLTASIDKMKSIQTNEKGLGAVKRGKQVASKIKKLDRHGYEKDENGHHWSAQSANGARAGSINANVRAQERTKMTRKSILRSIEGLLYPYIDKDIQFVFRKSPEYEFHEPLIKCEDVAVSFDAAEKALFYCDISVLQRSRSVILGNNGAGKTQLLKVLAKEMEPTEGRCVHCANVRVAHFSQMIADDILESVLLGETPMSFLARLFPLASDQELRSELSAFGIQASKVNTQVAKMSGGERVRVIYASLMLGNPQLLILDEPNNHLDLDSVEAIAVGLGNWDGTLVLSSHDSAMLRRIIDVSGADKPCAYYALCELDEQANLPYQQVLKRLSDTEFDAFFD
jgi:ATP-binding cassette subfamily F protein 3